jgi:hypothetical protein
MVVAASPARVWQEVGRATSASFPLPTMLRTIPQPVAVPVGEGASLGARRIVRFKGREGEGDLVLRVVRRTERDAVFEAVSDTSPIAMCVRHRSLTFRVEPAGAESRLTVASDYDRLLSPVWFFRPYIRVAAYLAVDVLARHKGTGRSALSFSAGASNKNTRLTCAQEEPNVRNWPRPIALATVARRWRPVTGEHLSPE